MKVRIAFDSSNISGPYCMPEVILKNYEIEYA